LAIFGDFTLARTPFGLFGVGEIGSKATGVGLPKALAASTASAAFWTPVRILVKNTQIDDSALGDGEDRVRMAGFFERRRDRHR
jgi:hypothetical protein